MILVKFAFIDCGCNLSLNGTLVKLTSRAESLE